MCTNPTKSLFWVILLSVVACGGGPARACSIPVFRYALERWPPDRYGVAVFHRGRLAQADQAVADRLKQRALDETAPCNMIVRLVDLQGQPVDGFQESFRCLCIGICELGYIG